MHCFARVATSDMSMLGRLFRSTVYRTETTPDGRFTLQEVECIGSCGTAPAMVINETFYYDLTVERVDEILDGLK